ncbi:DNA replication protein [Candidatus Pelagibacter sp.]|uniref:DNA replication protein n=1 Tax=Candidatus Pelagibacter sp. TaxID=2024849 RepID=UPI003F85D740
MTDLNQLILEFEFKENFKDQDFYVSNSNKQAYKLIKVWPKWEKKFLNICGVKFSGKTHLINIFQKNFQAIKIEACELNNNFLNQAKLNKNVIIENIDENTNVELLYSIYNIVDIEDKFLITTSNIPISEINFNLKDLRSRCGNFVISKILNPDDDLVYALIIKNLSDRQILIDKKLVDYIVKRITRSYGKISDFIYKIDQISLKEKKSIDFKIIKKALEMN